LSENGEEAITDELRNGYAFLEGICESEVNSVADNFILGAFRGQPGTSDALLFGHIMNLLSSGNKSLIDAVRNCQCIRRHLHIIATQYFSSKEILSFPVISLSHQFY